MRIIALLGVLFCMSFQTVATSPPAQGSDIPVSFIGLKGHYSPDQIVSFQITSTESEDVRLSCAVEQLINSAWREVSMSVFAGDPAKATRVVILHPGKGLSVEWDPWHKAPDAPFLPGRYRFRADVHTSETAALKPAYSKPFTLEPQPK